MKLIISTRKIGKPVPKIEVLEVEKLHKISKESGILTIYFDNTNKFYVDYEVEVLIE